MSHADITDILRQLAGGEMTLEDALQKAKGLEDPAGVFAQAPIDGATIDLGRKNRCGFGEVIYGEGKPADLIARIIQTQLDAGQTALVTRIDDGSAKELTSQFQFSRHNEAGRTLSIADEQPIDARPLEKTQFDQPHVAVVTAGSTDAPVAEEAIETLAWMKIPFQRFDDIGVAGPQRLLNAVDDLRKASTVIVIAGMEGALPAVVAGHLAVPIIAVPTSVGYGTSLGGLTALFGMLSSCASNVAVVNIDAGFKAAYLAGMMIDQLRRARD